VTKISIAMATYNGGLFIQELLNSLSTQTQLPSELVICDDMSADDTIDIVEEFAKTAPFPVRSFRNERRLGYGPNFMKAASLCNSEVIAFCDQDDIWLPHKLKRLSDVFSTDQCIAVYHDLTIVDKENKIISPFVASPKPDKINPWSLIPGLALAFRSEFLNYGLWEESVNHKRPNERMAHDQWICFMAISLGRMVHLADSLVRYRQHGKNTFGAFYAERKSAVSRSMQYMRLASDNFRGHTANIWAKRLFWYEILYGNQQGTKSRIKILRQMLPSISKDRREQAGRRLAYYEGLERTLALRLAAYEETRQLKRARALVAAVACGAYKGKNAGFKELIQDSFFGVLVSLPTKILAADGST
jgi:glycosyltransferase involved in cell wall biosynthesis